MGSHGQGQVTKDEQMIMISRARVSDKTLSSEYEFKEKFEWQHIISEGETKVKDV